jgi:hypothetical protein
VTLLITVATRDVIHTCVDFRLASGTGGFVAETQATKQVTINSFKHFFAHVFYTGIALDENVGYDTIGWVEEFCKSAKRAPPELIVEGLASMGELKLQSVQPEYRGLTMVVAAATTHGTCRLFRISNLRGRQSLPGRFAQEEFALDDAPLVIDMPSLPPTKIGIARFVLESLSSTA